MAENNRCAAQRRGKPRQGLTETEYARHLGISQSAVNQAKSKGRIVLHEDGSIDQEASDVIYFRETSGDPVQYRVKFVDTTIGTGPALGPATDDLHLAVMEARKYRLRAAAEGHTSMRVCVVRA